MQIIYMQLNYRDSGPCTYNSITRTVEFSCSKPTIRPIFEITFNSIAKHAAEILVYRTHFYVDSTSHVVMFFA